MKTSNLFHFLAMTLGLVTLAGCASGKAPGTTSHAAVNIQNRTTGDIQETTKAVFSEHGYHLTSITPSEMVFERPGNSWDSLKWGGWTAGVTMRVKVQQNDMANGTHLLQANAYSVQNSSDPFFRTESRTMMINHQPYQKILNEVAKRLKVGP